MDQQVVDLASKGTGWLLAVYFFYKYIAEKDKRFEDSKGYVNTVLAPLKSLQDTLDAILLILKNGGKNND